MENPRLSRSRSAMVLTASVIAMLVTRAVPDGGEWVTLRVVLLIAGMVGAMFSSVWLLMAWIELRRYTRLKAGVGVIARWTVDPQRWEWFRHLSGEWDRREGVRPNLVKFDQDPGTAGIEVVVTGDCILIGGNFHTFEKTVTIESHPDWIGFHQIIPKPNGPHFHEDLRIPLAPSGQHQADRIKEVYGQAYATAAANPRTKIYVLLGIVLFILAFTGLAALLGHLLEPGP